MSLNDGLNEGATPALNFAGRFAILPEEIMRDESPGRRHSGPLSEVAGEHFMHPRTSCASQEVIPAEGGVSRPRSVRIASPSHQPASPNSSPRSRVSPRGSFRGSQSSAGRSSGGGLGLGANNGGGGVSPTSLAPTSAAGGPVSPMSSPSSQDQGRRLAARSVSKTNGRSLTSSTTVNLDRIVQMQFAEAPTQELHKQPTQATQDSSSMWRTSSDRPLYYDPVANIATWITRGKFGSSDGQEDPGEGEDDEDAQDVQEHDGDRVPAESRGCRGACTMIVEIKSWQIGFMTLTFYALFAVDIDMVWGSEASNFALSIVTTVVFVFFLVELIVQSIGKSGYLLRAYFWLDLIALVSLLPDTWLLQELLTSSNEFVAARSSKIARLIRVASRTTKASRLNRLIKIVRVASLMPRIMAALSKNKDREVRDLVSKKLFSVFAYVDEDADGFISQELVVLLMSKLRPAGGKEIRKAKTADSRADPVDNTESFAATATGATVGTGMSHAAIISNQTIIMPNFSDFGLEDGDQVGFDDFQRILLSDEKIKGRLLRATRQHLKHKNNMQQITSRHSEDMGFKVALGVLLMLLVQSFVEPVSVDKSNARGLKHLDLQAHSYLVNATATDPIPPAIVEHVSSWLNGVDGERQVRYLDLQWRVFCDDFHAEANPCSASFVAAAVESGEPLYWTPRLTIKEIDDNIGVSEYRMKIDLEPSPVPEDATEDVDERTDEEINATMTSYAIIDIRDIVEFEAQMSMLTTALVIVIILVGIAMLTKDMMFLSQSLLRPLRNLAEEMRTIVQMQMAGLEDKETIQRHVVAEIDLIQRIFDNMKKAIKSWGKYVPWPVVQLLLQAGEDAKTGVREEEVSIFFSDIASFTTIVESLPPESSLRLLSRYFNDMSKVIDEYQGIVIEYIGDAILAVYGCPVKDPDHASSSVKATLKMLQALDKINVWSGKEGLPQVKIRCGVHTGSVLIGNMGFHSRMKYGVVGEDSIIPGRLEEMNKTYGTDMLCSKSTLEKLVKNQFIVRAIDIVNLSPSKGRQVADPDVVYQVLARSKQSPKTLSEAARLHSMALSEYRDKNFQKSAAMFAQVNEQMREIGFESDMASAVLMKRAQFYAERPPEEAWNGVWDQLTEPQ